MERYSRWLDKPTTNRDMVNLVTTVVILNFIGNMLAVVI